MWRQKPGKMQTARRYLSARTSDTLLTMPFSSRVGSSTATVLWAAEPVDSHMRVHTWSKTRGSNVNARAR